MKHRVTLDALAAALVERETVDDTELAELFKDMDKWEGIPRDVPVVTTPPLAPQAVVPVPVADPIPGPVVPVSALSRIGRVWRRAPRPSAP